MMRSHIAIAASAGRAKCKGVLERLGLDFGSSGPPGLLGRPFAFDFRTSWHSALRLAFARATAFDQQNVKRQSGAFAFVLRLAARARPRDFHDFTRDVRGHVLFVAPKYMHLVT